ncbi:MAG: DNA mismatch repair endonuclease MutL [Candidatus Cryptobacteroides sp.]|nr:DNA mismatch repair endonuclease MutL [Candidatus Cryptobacteroides sp.]
MDIRILPGNIANMIAAGEVVQRPASVVKELMENAVDAGASQVTVILTDAGRTLIQVIDNGCGMTPDEAVLCFERHATSKIATAEDLNDITTFGFRGEALASVAAVAEVTLKTRRPEDEVGCKVEFAGSVHISTDEISTPAGSNFAVRNLFYNVPARRKFLKSDNVEFKHVVEEFTRVALTRPETGFSLSHNGREIFSLKPAKSLKYRIQDLLGNNVVSQVVDVSAETSVVRVNGYVGRPDQARKTLGNQFFFVNGRFFRSPYFHKAVMNAYDNLLPPGATPSYFIYLEVDPHSIDVNIHPTKTEIKFEDDSVIFQIIYACIKESIGRNSFGASIDFNREDMPELPVLSKDFSGFQPEAPAPSVSYDPDYNPFDAPAGGGSRDESRGTSGNFGIDTSGDFRGYSAQYVEKREDYGKLFEDKMVARPAPLVIDRKYIVSTGNGGIVVTSIRRARERVLYDRFLAALRGGEHVSQSALFPVQVNVGVDNRLIFDENAEMLSSLGFDISPFGNDTIVVNGMPEGFQVDQSSVESAMADVLIILSEGGTGLQEMMESSMAEKFARMAAAGCKDIETSAEAAALIDSLYSSSNPEFTPGGRRTMRLLTSDDIEKMI